jgi:hypothetical protein
MYQKAEIQILTIELQTYFTKCPPLLVVLGLNKQLRQYSPEY